MNEHFITRRACPCCGSADVRVIRESPYDAPPIRDYLDRFYARVGRVEHEYLAGAAYVLAACQTCDAVFQRDIPGDALMERLYERWMDPAKVFEVYERARGVNAYAYLARQVETVVRYLGGPPSALKLLDFGMGWGHWCRFANAYGCEAYGLEVSAARIAYARAQGVRVLDYDALDAHEFNMINAEQILEHVPDPLATLQRLARRLRPGGIIWLAVPDGTDIRTRIDRWDWDAPKESPRSLNPVAPLEHINCFTPRTLAQMAARAGLKPVTVTARRTPARRATGWHAWLRRPPPPAAATTEGYFTAADAP